jgi:hypothetical protein
MNGRARFQGRALLTGGDFVDFIGVSHSIWILVSVCLSLDLGKKKLGRSRPYEGPSLWLGPTLSEIIGGPVSPIRNLSSPKFFLLEDTFIFSHLPKHIIFLTPLFFSVCQNTLLNYVFT